MTAMTESHVYVVVTLRGGEIEDLEMLDGAPTWKLETGENGFVEQVRLGCVNGGDSRDITRLHHVARGDSEGVPDDFHRRLEAAIREQDHAVYGEDIVFRPDEGDELDYREIEGLPGGVGQ